MVGPCIYVDGLSGAEFCTDIRAYPADLSRERICNMELDKQTKTVSLRLIVDVDPGHSIRRSNPPSR